MSSPLSVPNPNSMIQVVGVGVATAKTIVSYLSRYTAEMVLSGISGIVIAYNDTVWEIRIHRRRSQAYYAIKVNTELALLISRAADTIENHPEIRPEIKKAAVEQLMFALDVIWGEVRAELLCLP